MRDKGLDFDVALGQAQALGYAEADPTFDIEGVDAAHKATIMSAIAFGIPVQFEQGLRRRHRAAAGGRHHLCRAARLPHQAARHHQAPRRPSRAGHRAARAPDAGAGDAPDRQRRRRDERGAGAGRRGRHDALLRQGRRRRADRLGGGRRPGRHHAAAHRRPGPPRAAPRVPARRDGGRRRSCRSTRSSPRSTCACRSPTRPACWRASPASWPSTTSRSTRCCSGRTRSRGAVKRDRRHHPHARHRRRPHERRRSRRCRRSPTVLAPIRRIRKEELNELGPAMKYISTRGDRGAARLLRHPARGPRARRRAVPARALSARRRARRSPRWRGLGYAELAFELLSLYIDDIRAADLRALVARDLHAPSAVRHAREITPLRAARAGRCLLQRLSNGPTLAFKDMAMQLLGNAVRVRAGAPRRDAERPRRDLGRHRQRRRIRDARQARRAGLHALAARPHERRSSRRRCSACRTPNIHNIAIEGVFDDCQDIVKAVSNDLDVQARAIASAPSTRSTGRGCWRRSCTTSPATSAATRAQRRAGRLHRAVGQLRQHLRRPRRAHDGPADPAAGARDQRERRARRVLPHRQLPRARAAPRRTRPRARRWTSRRRRTSSASSSTCSAATRRACASCSATARAATACSRLTRDEFARVAELRLRLAAAARMPTAWRRSATPHARFGVVIDTHTADGAQGGARARSSRACR